jgi:hypothetical protein
MPSPSATQDSYPYQNEPIWSRSEKAIARKAFDAALGRELHEVIQKAKQMANEIQQSSDLWTLAGRFSKSAMASLEKSRNSLQTGSWRRASFHASL